MNSTTLAVSAGNLRTLIARTWRYMMAPFYPSEWTKPANEVKSLTPQKAKTELLKVALYYLLFSPLVAMPFYNTLLFHPYVTGAYSCTELAGSKKQDVFFTNANGTRLHGWYFSKAGSKKTVLVSHGNAGNLSHRQDLCSLLLLSGASVFIYDYSGFGMSHGSPTVDGCINDAVAAFDYLNKTLKIPADHIVLYGESIGTGFTAQLAEKRPCAAIILQSAFQSLPEIVHEKLLPLRIYPDFMFPTNHLDTLSFVKGQHPPLLIIHGMQDSIIPCHNADDLYAAASGTKALVKLPKAGHNDITDNTTYECLGALSRFLR